VDQAVFCPLEQRVAMAEVEFAITEVVVHQNAAPKNKLHARLRFTAKLVIIVSER